MSQLSSPETYNTELLQTSAESEIQADTNVGTDHVMMALENNNNYGYMGEFWLGSTGGAADSCSGELQKIRILLDTGSANSWIMSKKALPANYSPSNGERFTFDPEQSCGNTFHEPEKHDITKITFGSGYLKGYFVDDACTLGNPNSSNAEDKLVLPKYNFGMVVEETCFHTNFDAIIGMAYPQFAEKGVTPFFDAMMNAGILHKNVFAFHMSMNPDDETSEVTFGEWNKDRIDPDYNEGTGMIDWHPVEHQLFFSIKLDDVKLNGESLHLCDDKECLFTPDTGTSLITFPSWAMKQFESENSELAGKHACKDGNEFSYGDLTYVINDIEYPMPSHHFMSREVNTNGGDD